jgi:hypothetical protein
VNRPVLVALVLFLALPAAAEFCDLDLRYENGEVRWKPIVGALRYTVLETYGGLKPPFYYSTTRTFVTVDHRASEAMTVRYIVTAEVEEGVRIKANATTWRDACTGMIDVPIAVNAEFRRFTRRAIVPVAGSTPGAFGGQFKTALELRGAANESGRIVFHPAGKVAADDDPSIPYSFVNTRVIVHDDVVGAMGQKGLGSLEIVPDAASVDRIPEVSVRLYNDTAMGTFGTYAAPVLPYDYLRPEGVQIRVPDARFRLNIGITTLAAASMEAVIRRADGRLDGLRTRTFPAGWMEMKSAADFIGTALNPGDQVTLSFNGAAVPFYPSTENATNDPTLVIVPAEGTSRNVGNYVD